MSEHHVSSLRDKLNAKIILFKIYLYIFLFTDILRYPDHGAKANRLQQVSVMGKLWSNKGPLLHPSYTLVPLIPACGCFLNYLSFISQETIGFIF